MVVDGAPGYTSPDNNRIDPFQSQSAMRAALVGGQWLMAGQPAKNIPHVACHVITILSLFNIYYADCRVGAIFKLYLYNIPLQTLLFVAIC